MPKVPKVPKVLKGFWKFWVEHSELVLFEVDLVDLLLIALSLRQMNSTSKLQRVRMLWHLETNIYDFL